MIKYNRQFLPFALFFLLIISSTQAQNFTNYTHYTLWSRLTVAKVWNKKWDFSGEYQYRRQNYHKSSLNPTESNLLQSGRLRLRYTHSKNLNFILYPISYFYSFPLLGSKADYLKLPDKEYRFAALAEFIQEFGKFYVLNRYGYELRWIKRSTDDHFVPANRYRYRLLLEKPIFSKSKERESIRPYTSGEVFFVTGKDIKLPQVFDHIRLTSGARISLSTHLKMDVGYQYARRLRRNGKEGDHEHSLVTNITIVL